MKTLKVIGSLLLVFVMCSAFTMQKDKEGVYIAGVSASFSDSLVYFTDVIFVDSVSLDKDKFLPERYQYSSQLTDYLLQKHGLRNRTSFVLFGEKKEKLEKTIKKLKEKYKKAGKNQLQQVDADFKFKKAVGY